MRKILSQIILFLILIQGINFAQNFWERIPSPTDKFLRALHFADSLRGWAAGDSGLIFYTSDGGVNWNKQQTNTTSKIQRLFFLDDNRAWALAWADASILDTTFFGTEILKTTDGGLNWSVEQYREQDVFLKGIYFLDTLRGFAGGVPGQFLQTSDGGLNWEPANIDSGTFSHFPVIDFKFYNKLYGYACGGRFDIAGVIWRTTTGGANWTPIEPQYAPADQVFDVHFFDSLNVLGVGGDPDLFGVGIINSTDAGNSWDYFEIGVFGQAQSISFRTENEGWAVVPLSGMMVATYDYGINWLDYFAPDTSSLYEIIFTDSLTGYAVGEEGVILKYKYQNPDNIGEDLNTAINDFILNQNYPNPFNPSTQIEFYLPISGNVNLSVFNVLGQEIQTLINHEYSNSGKHTIEFNGEDLPSGIYLYKLQVDDYSKVKKMILLK